MSNPIKYTAKVREEALTAVVAGPAERYAYYDEHDLWPEDTLDDLDEQAKR